MKEIQPIQLIKGSSCSEQTKKTLSAFNYGTQTDKKDEFYDLLRLLQDGRMEWKNKVKGMETKEPSFQSEWSSNTII